MKLHARQGFSLIEILVVLAILGLSVALTLPRLDNVIENAQVRTAVREMAAGLRYSRSNAITRQQEMTLSLDVEASAYLVDSRRKQMKLPADTIITLTTARSEQQSDTSGTIRFFPDGSSTGGRIDLQRDTVHYSIDVNWLTGRISIGP